MMMNEDEPSMSKPVKRTYGGFEKPSTTTANRRVFTPGDYDRVSAVFALFGMVSSSLE
jgi:hypothetical protein